jgi:hypothetical protein
MSIIETTQTIITLQTYTGQTTKIIPPYVPPQLDGMQFFEIIVIIAALYVIAGWHRRRQDNKAIWEK